MRITHVRSNKKIIQLIILLLLAAGIIFTVVLAQQQQQTQQQAAVNCGDTRNLIRNCDFTTAINFNNRTGPDWRDTATDPMRNAGAGQYTREVAQISTSDHGLVGQIGKESGTCSLPKTAGGGGNDLFRLYPEIGQYVDVSNASKFHVAFDFHMKSRHTRHQSAPFYVWTALTDGTGDKKGVEAFLAYVPHDTPGDVCEEQPFRTDLKCKIGAGAPETDCTEAVNGWKRVEYDVDRNAACEGDAGCKANNKLFHIGFGVTNDYDTLVQFDNVVVTAEGVSGPQPTPTPTPTPQVNPNTRASFYFTKEDGTRVTPLTKRPGDRETLNLYLDTKGSSIIEFAVKITFPDNWILEDALRGSDDSKFPEPPLPVKWEKPSDHFYFSKINLNGVTGNLQLAKLKLKAQSTGTGRIKFDYTELTKAGCTTNCSLAHDFQHLSYTINSSGGSTPPGGPTATPPSGGAGQPPTSRRTFFLPNFSIPCVTPTTNGITFGCLLFAPRP